MPTSRGSNRHRPAHAHAHALALPADAPKPDSDFGRSARGRIDFRRRTISNDRAAPVDAGGGPPRGHDGDEPRRGGAGSGDASAPAPIRLFAATGRADHGRPPIAPSDRECYRASVPIPRRYTTDAIVLSRFDFGEADRILTLITPGGGKIKAIAKGIRRPTSRLGGSLEPFAELQVSLARGRTFEVVTQVSVGHAWLKLRDSLEGAATAWYLAELADRSLEEQTPAEPLYGLLRRAYELLDAGMAAGRVARWYEMHLADELGVRPEVDRCAECDRMLEPEGRFRWVPQLGGVVCDRCPGPSHERFGLTVQALKLLKAYQRLDVVAIASLRLAGDTEREVEAALREFIGHAIERNARSLAFLDEVRAGVL